MCHPRAQDHNMLSLQNIYLAPYGASCDVLGWSKTMIPGVFAALRVPTGTPLLCHFHHSCGNKKWTFWNNRDTETEVAIWIQMETLLGPVWDFRQSVAKPYFNGPPSFCLQTRRLCQKGRTLGLEFLQWLKSFANILFCNFLAASLMIF